MKKNFTLVFGNVQQEHLGKDVFLVPYYLGKTLEYDVRIIYPMSELNKDLPSEHRGVKLIPIAWHGKIIHNQLFKLIVMIVIWARYVMRSDVLMLFHYYGMRTPRWGVIYKLFHPHGRLYVKMDASLSALKNEDNYKNYIERIYKNGWHWMFAKVVDCITCETQSSYDAIMKSKATLYKFREKLFIMPNAFDDEALTTYNIRVNPFLAKKNQFITVGRIGAPEKNNEMLLRALGRLELKYWKVFVVGPIDEGFSTKVERFFVDNPSLKDRVVFTGGINDKRELWQLYNDSKVFVFTSKTESAALVFVEANIFHNYIVSTNVGSFLDVTRDGVYGEEVPQDDDVVLAEKIQAIIDDKIDIDRYDDNYQGLKWSEVVKPVADKLR